MRRSYSLTAAVLMVFVIAVGLRVRSHFARRGVSLKAGGRPITQSASMPEPTDYVVHPWVYPDEVNRGPHRIISLAPSITEIVCALGMADRLVGRTQFCRHPPGVESVEKVGALIDPNFEKIKSLGPELVLTTSNSGRVIEGLEKLGVPYAAVPHNTLDGVYTAIERIGELCDRPKTAGALTACIQADIRSLRESARALQMPRRKVLVSLGDLPITPKAVWVAGPGSFLDSLVELAGHTNAAGGALQSLHGELPLAKLLALEVDVILTFGGEPTESQWRDLYQSWRVAGPLRAIRNQQVRCVGGTEWESAGPRIAIALHRFITVLSEFR